MTLITHSAAYATKHAAQALATTLILHSEMLFHDEAAELGCEMRDIFASLSECLSRIEDRAPDRGTAENLRTARSRAEDIALLLGTTYPPHATETVPAVNDQFTRITSPREIEALKLGRELVVDGAVYRIGRLPNGTKRVCDLADIEDISPELFFHRFGNTERGILLRH